MTASLLTNSGGPARQGDSYLNIEGLSGGAGTDQCFAMPDDERVDCEFAY